MTASAADAELRAPAAPPGPAIHALFHDQVASRPDAVAVRTADGPVSYADLDQRANRLAHRLGELGAGPECVVGVCLPRGLDLIIAVLAVLKADAAYLPIDPRTPPARRTELLTDAGATWLLTAADIAADTPAGLVALAINTADLSDCPAGRPPHRARGDNLAYVIHTSGSTGRPKPVGVTHESLVNHARALREYCALTPADRVLQFANLTFDAAAEELYPTWLAGAELVLLTDTTPATHVVQRLVRDQAVTVLNLPTSYWHLWADEVVAGRYALPASLRLVVIGGEAASGAVLARWERHTRIPVLNTYGVTEATITNLAHRPVRAEPDAPVPIGRPIPQTTAYVVDGAGHPAPVGVTGELLIGGVCLARGYLNRPELTADRFVPDPYGTRPGARLYRTGDLARVRADGDLEFCGRTDDQVKIRGQRIEPGEVAAAVATHHAVGHAYVAARESSTGGIELVAYVVPADPGSPPTAAQLRDHVAARLPAAMHPAAWVFLDALPLTAHGKVDRAALPTPDAPAAAGSVLAPETEVERGLAVIWRDVLGIVTVGLDDDFFEVGGDSLLAIKIMSRVGERFGLAVPVAVLFDYPTLGELAGVVADCLAELEDPSS